MNYKEIYANRDYLVINKQAGFLTTSDLDISITIPDNTEGQSAVLNFCTSP